MAEPFIRAIREADVAQIHAIETLCFAMPWSEESILHDVRENVVARWLVLDDGEGRVLAYAGMWLVIDEAHVLNVAVHPDVRRRGYGRRIFEALMALAQESGMGMITLEVLQPGCAKSVPRLRHARRGLPQALLRGQPRGRADHVPRSPRSGAVTGKRATRGAYHTGTMTFIALF